MPRGALGVLGPPSALRGRLPHAWRAEHREGPAIGVWFATVCGWFVVGGLV